MANQTLTPEAESILRRSTINGNALALPAGQLERKLYERINKFIELAGGRWDRKAKAHVFPGDPMKKLGLILETGVAVDERKKYQAFFTPPDLARRVAELGHVKGWRVLEPSAGHGALVEACARAGALAVKCIDINPEFCEKLRADGLQSVRCADFLTLPIPADPCGLYDRIVMNPPFTRRSDIKHVVRALDWLAPGGTLAAIMFGDWEDRRMQPLFDLVSGWDTYEEDCPDGAFRQSGTNVATRILRVTKP
jgi:SAM-dependent methyltransferase